MTRSARLDNRIAKRGAECSRPSRGEYAPNISFSVSLARRARLLVGETITRRARGADFGIQAAAPWHCVIRLQY